jgi:hypothetical protein
MPSRHNATPPVIQIKALPKFGKVFLRGRGKIRGGAEKWDSPFNMLSENHLHNKPNSLFLRGSKRNQGGAKKILKAES